MAVAIWLAKRAKVIFDDRGGMEGLKRDADRIRQAVSQGGTPQSKMRAVLAALKRPASTTDQAAAVAPTTR